jgi:hypothetical protein
MSEPEDKFTSRLESALTMAQISGEFSQLSSRPYC